MELLFRRRSYQVRSRGLLQFLQLLRDAYPDWVDMAGVEARIPGVSTRQLARFIDLLDASNLPLVRYETKTRGRYQLAVEPESIKLQGGLQLWKLAPAAVAPPAPVPVPPCASLEVYQDKNWIVWVVALLHSTLAFHGGQFLGEDGALGHLEDAEAAAATLPPWTLSVVQTLRAHALVRTFQYREATFWLRRVNTAIRHGYGHPATAGAERLIRARMLFDQSRYDESEQLIALAGASKAMHSPYWLNMNTLLSSQKLLTAEEGEAPRLLAQALSATADALGYVFLWEGDSSLLDCLLYNFGNNLLCGINRGLLPAACTDTVLQWLAANMLACRKLGIGNDSIMTSLLLIDVALDHGLSPEHWPPLLRQDANLSGDLDGLLNQALDQSRRAGNRLEVAQCLRRWIRLAASSDKARPAYFEAMELFTDLGHKDAAIQLTMDWHRKFGTPPPHCHGLRTP